MNLASVLPARAALHPRKPAIATSDPGGRSDRVLTYQELQDAVARTARGLVRSGLRPGDGLLLLQPMSAELYILLLAAWWAGGTVLLLDPGRGLGHVAACVRRWRPRALAGPALVHWASWLVPGLRRGGALLGVRTSGWAPGTVALAAWMREGAPVGGGGPAEVADDAPALVTFTTGSTGAPKAVVRSHGFLREQHRVLAALLRHEADPVEAVTLPVFLLSSLASGTTAVVPPGDIGKPGRIAADAVARQWARWQPVQTGASPAFLERMLGDVRGVAALARLRTILTGGGPVRTALLRRLRRVAPGTRVVVVYGSTEAEPIAEINADEVVDPRGAAWADAYVAAGHVASGVACVLVEPEAVEAGVVVEPEAFARLALGRGRIGEILVSGPLVIRGYLGGVGDAETKVRVGERVWHRTGDAGVFDDAGRLWLAGRVGGRVRVAGGWVYPFPAENLALACRGVTRAALVEVGGRAWMAVEVERGDVAGVVEAALVERGWGDVRVCVVPAIPLDARHNAKVDTVRLRRIVARCAGRGPV